MDNEDRVPLNDLIVKEAKVEGIDLKKEIPEPSKKIGVVNQSISELQDMRALRALLGFSGRDFEGHGEKAIKIYEWARAKTGLKMGPQVIMEVKKLIKKMGISDVKGSLLTKLAQYASLDSEIEQLKVAKKAI